MDREKVIKTLEDRIRDCSMIGDGFDVTINWKLADEILALLKEQEAVEPVLIREGRNKNYNDYVCPCCGYEVVYEQNYCSECGVQFLWEGR